MSYLLSRKKNEKHFSYFVLTVTLTVVTAVFAGAGSLYYFYERRRRAVQDDKDRKAGDNGEKQLQRSKEEEEDDGVFDLLPSHLKHDLRKEERRQRLLPRLAMNKPLYDNILMLDPDGQLLATISLKKAHWYVRKNLATWQEEQTNGDNDSNKSIRLVFHPKGKAREESRRYNDTLQYNRTIKKNQCVVCGDTEHYMRHYVVPVRYRTLFPREYKDHLPHDVVLLCHDCQINAERASFARQKQLEWDARMNCGYVTSDRLKRIDSTLYNVNSAGKALSKWKFKLPPERIQEYETLLLDHYQTTTIDDELLKRASQLEYRVINQDYVSGAKLVVESLVGNNNIADFVRDWRRHFVETMGPRYLPCGWKVDSPVKSDPRFPSDQP